MFMAPDIFVIRTVRFKIVGSALKSVPPSITIAVQRTGHHPLMTLPLIDSTRSA